ncbi:membrane protein [Streptomyces sp. WM6372]|uniref:zinc ribbon domain-containing protein n=1 Tax=Streptomyces sp. WM6372 TaxID=1415555 RepID=UPI0006AD95AD|nr:zinc ribbon domain-containing protein [Streptomyces sp. WM6372]KOU23320.1 membrane protein [Streptomyces sp. WM6372]
MSTQNCAECGTPAEPGQSFCDACGAVLGWDRDARAARPAVSSSHLRGPAADTAGTPYEAARPDRNAPDARTAGGSDTGVPAPAPAPAGTTAGTMDAIPAPRAARAAGSSGGTGPAPASVSGGPLGSASDREEPEEPEEPAGPGTARSSEATGTPAAAGPAGPARRGGEPDRSGPSDDTMSDRARSLLVPVADPEAPHPAPEAARPVLPGRPDTGRPAVRAPGQQPGIEGGPPCRWCSTPNRSDRHYCVRCAMPLAVTGEAAVPGRAPWWRRIFGGRHRETPWAGDRPRLRRVFDRIGTWIVLVVVATAAVLGFVYLPDRVQAARDHFAKRAPVAPDRLAASRSYPGHQPELAFDKRSNTWWGPGVSQSGQGEWIEATFSEPTRLLDLIITPGVSVRADKVGESALPHRVTATITGKDGKVTTRRLILDQGAGGQRRPFRVGEVTKVRFTVESSHATSADKQVAISEIEFFGPSNANRS